MKISIITVTLNSAPTLSDTIESVLSQQYDDYEYIIIDGASIDGTLSIIKEFEPKFNGRMSWVSEPDKGLYDAMNKGFKLAQGDILALINSDDFFIDNQAFEKISKLFQSNPEIDGVYADLCYISPNDKNRIIRRWVSGDQKPFKKGWSPAHPTFYVKKTIYERFGYFDLKYRLAADFELMLRFVEKNHIKLSYLDDFLVKMRLGGLTNNSFLNIIEQNKECLQAFRDNGLPVSTLYPFYRLLHRAKQFIV